MDRFEAMTSFVTIADIGSISGAADKLGISKSVVSRRLKELEEHLGVELFHRSTRKMNLTDTGHSFYHRAMRLIEDLDEAELLASQAHYTLKGRLKVALPLTFGTMHMSSAINEFLRDHPDIEFDLDFNDREVDLIQEGFDLAIRIADLPDSTLIARRLATINTMLCASPIYLDNMGIPETPEDLKKHQCMVYTVLRDYEHWHFEDAKNKRYRVKIHPYIKASTGDYLRDAAIDNHGITLAPTFIVYEAIKNRTLIPLLKDYKTEQINAYAIYPQTRHLSQRVRAFVDFLVDRFSGMPYWDREVDSALSDTK